MGQTATISRNNTSIRSGTDNEGRATLTVRLHSTDVVTLTMLGARYRHALAVTLNSGGWRTVTTKARINQVAHEYRLPFRVQQDRGQWYVSYDSPRRFNVTVEFEDGLTFPVVGSI